MGVGRQSGGLVVAGVLVLAPATALVLGESPGEAAGTRVPVSIHLPAVHQHELVTSGVMRVRLRSWRKVRVRVSSSLEGPSGSRTLTRPRTLLLRRGRTRTLHLRLAAPQRADLARCERRRVVLTVEGRRGSHRLQRRASTPLRLDPPACGRFFGPRSVWNTPLASGTPLDPDSQAITDVLKGEVADSYLSPPHPTINTTTYSTPIYTVGRSHPRSRVALDEPPGWAPHLEARFASVPVPAQARPAAGSDGHMVVWQPSTDTLWEFWRMRLEPAGWRTSWGGRLDGVSSGPGHFAPPVANLGATATSLPLVGGLITAQELRRGQIDHALALAVPGVRQGVHALPAQRSDGGSTAPYSVPEGARFRLDPALDIDALGLPAAVRAMAEAAQRYGIIVRDQSSVVAFYAEDPSPSGTDPYPALFDGAAPWDLLRIFPWQHLQLVRMELVESPGDGRPLVCRLLACN